MKRKRMKTRKILLCLILIMALVISTNAAVFASTGLNYTIVASVTDEAVDTPAPEEKPDPPSITIQNIPASMQVGEKATLSYTIKNSDEDNVTWKSNNPDILSVDAGGKLTAVAAGTATITATAGKAKDSIKITVDEVQPEEIEIVSDDFGITSAVTGKEIKKGNTVKLEVKVSPKEATVSGIKWEVDNPKIAEVDEGGTLIALDNGEVVVTATTSEDLSAEIEIKISNNIPWVMIGIIAPVVIVIIILVTLIIRSKMRSNKRSRKRRKYDDDDDEYEDDDDDEDDKYDNNPTDDDQKKKQEELERLRREAYEQGYKARDKEMTKVFDPKDFELDKDDDIE